MRQTILPALAMSIGLTGCGSLVASLNQENEVLVSAAPLFVAPTLIPTKADASAKKEYLGSLVYDSEQKCLSFLNRLVLTRNTVDTAGDIISAGLSGAGALISPILAAHALSGAATFVTGSKAAIDADIYAKASLTSFQTALQNTYMKYMLDYTDKLPKIKDEDLILSNEIAKIQSIHATCGLAPAEVSIQAKINAPLTASGIAPLVAAPLPLVAAPLPLVAAPAPPPPPVNAPPPRPRPGRRALRAPAMAPAPLPAPSSAVTTRGAPMGAPF